MILASSDEDLIIPDLGVPVRFLKGAGGDVTGPAVFDALQTSADFRSFPNDTLLQCGLASAYPSVCSFEFPIGEYVEGGELRVIPGFENTNVVDYLP